MKKKSFDDAFDVLLKYVQVRDGLKILPSIKDLAEEMGSKGCATRGKKVNAVNVYTWKRDKTFSIEAVLDYCKVEGLDPFEIIYC